MASAMMGSVQSLKQDTCLDGENPCTGETFRLGIAQFKYQVVWSLREAMAPERKRLTKVKKREWRDRAA